MNDDNDMIVVKDEWEAESLLNAIEKRLQEETKVMHRGYEMGEEYTLSMLKERVENSLIQLRGTKPSKARDKAYKAGMLKGLESVLEELTNFKNSPPNKRTVFFERVHNASSSQQN